MATGPDSTQSSPNAEIVRQLGALGLLGAGLSRASALVPTLSPDATRPWEIPYWTGVLRFYSREVGASDLLLEAAELARRAGARETSLRAALLAARALAAVGRPSSAATLLEPLEAELQAHHTLYADHRLARAACGHPDARQLWEEALPQLPSPARDADRLEVLLGLGLMARNGGDGARARRHWERALALAQAHEDDRERLRLACLLGNAAVEAGLPHEAEPRLAEAVTLAERLDETLVLLAEGTILAALQLGRADYAAAEATAARCATAAAARNNPAAIADAAITRAAARQGQGDAQGAIRALWDAANLLRDRGSAAGLNLLKARLAELRAQLGPERFDPLWMAVATPKVG